ncbi:MAG TPA: hypothetical protein VLE95_07685, partial [Chlamydiales bacterium]|nr:hypothetical protein [Chlamydiales bacterium]
MHCFIQLIFLTAWQLGGLQSQQFIITTETDTTEAREALALPKIAALRRLCGVYLCGGPTLQ